jgi:hypothetical protein
MDEVDFHKMYTLARDFAGDIDDGDIKTAMLSVLSMISDLNARVIELSSAPEDEE